MEFSLIQVIISTLGGDVSYSSSTFTSPHLGHQICLRFKVGDCEICHAKNTLAISRVHDRERKGRGLNKGSKMEIALGEF